MAKVFRCYAVDGNDRWEAFCIDLDLAVTGRSFEEVYGLLTRAIRTYVQDAKAEGPEQAVRLLNRRAPLAVRLKFLWAIACSWLWNPPKDGGESADFTVSCHA